VKGGNEQDSLPTWALFCFGEMNFAATLILSQLDATLTVGEIFATK
jgi:hypothetical protein